MDTYSVVVVGMGFIGQQHFQSLTKLNVKTRIMCINRSGEALDKAREFFKGVSNPNIVSVEFSQNLDSAWEEIDLAVIAINSLPRRSTIETLLSRCRVRYMLLEKYLFPAISDYAAVGKLLQEHGTQAYVNCQRRMLPNYIALRERLRSDPLRVVISSGSRWGLGCNSVHVLDLIDFLTGSRDLSVTCHGELLDDGLLESKRKGYVEFTGRLTGRINGQVDYVLDSTLTGDTPFSWTFFTKNGIITICEFKRMITYCDGVNGRQFSETFTVSNQSLPTGEMAEELFRTGSCRLIPYERSAKLHLAVLGAMLKKQSLITGTESEVCLIT